MINKKINQKNLSLIEYYNLLDMGLLINNFPINRLGNSEKISNGLKKPNNNGVTKMINDNIKVEIEMIDSTALFAVKRMVGYRTLHNDNFSVDLTLAGDEGDERTSLIFHTNLEGFEDVSRIIQGIEELNLGKQEEEETED